MDSLLCRVVVLTAIPDLFSVMSSDLIVLTGWPRILIFENVPGAFKSWEQLPTGRGGRVFLGGKAQMSANAKARKHLFRAPLRVGSDFAQNFPWASFGLYLLLFCVMFLYLF